MPEKQDTKQELDYQKEQAKSYHVAPTPEKTIERYRVCANSSVHAKERMFELVHKCKPTRICDFGCGGGESSTEFAALGYSVTGVDISPEMIEIARKRAEVDNVVDSCRFLVGAAPGLVWKGEPVDLIFIEGVLHHIVDIEAGLKCLDGILRPGGFLVIQEPIAFSGFLKLLRKLIPVKTDLSPNERQLNRRDIDLIGSYFPIKEQYNYRLFTRLDRVFGDRAWFGKLDFRIACRLPFLKRYFGTLVMLAQKPENGSGK